MLSKSWPALPGTHLVVRPSWNGPVNGTPPLWPRMWIIPVWSSSSCQALVPRAVRRGFAFSIPVSTNNTKLLLHAVVFVVAINCPRRGAAFSSPGFCSQQEENSLKLSPENNLMLIRSSFAQTRSRIFLCAEHGPEANIGMMMWSLSPLG